MQKHSPRNLSRADLLRALGAASIGAIFAPALLRPLPARAVVPVFDPAAVAALLKELANDFVKNKEALYTINILLHQWYLMQEEHHIDIMALWTDIEPKLVKFQDQLVKNKKLGIATDNILEALEEALPDYNPSDPIHTGIELYQDYIALSAQTAKKIVSQTSQTAQDMAKARQNNVGKALGANTQRAWFQYSYLMSKDIADGIGLLQAAVNALITTTANYYEAKMKEGNATSTMADVDALRLAGANLGTPPKNTLQQYVNGDVQLVPYNQ